MLTHISQGLVRVKAHGDPVGTVVLGLGMGPGRRLWRPQRLDRPGDILGGTEASRAIPAAATAPASFNPDLVWGWGQWEVAGGIGLKEGWLRSGPSPAGVVQWTENHPMH